MLVDVKCKAICKIDIDAEESFRLLCKTLDMDFVLDENTEFIVKKNEYDELCVYTLKDNKEKIFDDRGNLFVSLRNVAVNMFPNLSFRGDNYIYNND